MTTDKFNSTAFTRQHTMTYDYSFFEQHKDRQFTFECPASERVGSSIDFFFNAVVEGKRYHVVVPTSFEEPYPPAVVQCSGAYSKGGQNIDKLTASLATELPEDFVQFYERFGETLILTRSKPVWILSLDQIIESYENDLDTDEGAGRFFRFARFPEIWYLCLRQNEDTDKWQLVGCDYGLLYSEMIGSEGRESIVGTSFYNWLKHLIDTNGYGDTTAPFYDNQTYLTVLDSDQPGGRQAATSTCLNGTLAGKGT